MRRVTFTLWLAVLAPLATGASAQQPPSAPAPEAETVFWQSIANSRNPAEFRAYLRRFPDGMFAELARARLQALEREQAATASPSDPPQRIEQPPAAPQPGPAPGQASLPDGDTTDLGMWAVNTLAACRGNFYDWRILNGRFHFTRANGEMFVERILQSRPTGYLTQAESSSRGGRTTRGNGALWEYRRNPDGSYVVQNLSAGQPPFRLLKCPEDRD